MSRVSATEVITEELKKKKRFLMPQVSHKQGIKTRLPRTERNAVQTLVRAHKMLYLLLLKFVLLTYL